MIMVIEGRFKGKKAIITGASSGIGRATAIRFAKEGGISTLISLSITELEEVAKIIRENGGEVFIMEADVSREGQLSKAIDDGVSRMDGLDIVISNAGIELPFEDSMSDSLPIDIWQRIINTNLTGQFLTCKHGISHLLKTGGGAVVMVGSPCGEKGFCFKEHAYSASKGGILSLMRVMALDYISYNIRVNACIPGFINTPMNDHILKDSTLSKTWIDTIPLKRPGTAEEVAAVILFLSSNDSSYVVGSAFAVDGGLLAA